MAQTWFNADGLLLKFGTDKATSNIGGEYLSYGPNRVLEFLIDMTALTTSNTNIISDTLFFPAGSNTYIEEVQLVAETACATGTSFSVGLIQADRTTIPTGYDTAFVAALDAAGSGVLDTAGAKLILTDDSTGQGTLIGSYAAGSTQPYYVTAFHATTAYTTGLVRVRILYHGTGTIDDASASTKY